MNREPHTDNTGPAGRARACFTSLPTTFRSGIFDDLDIDPTLMPALAAIEAAMRREEKEIAQ